MGEHTKGPWHWDGEDPGIEGPNGGVVAFVQEFTSIRTQAKFGTGFSHADARLIAAAPELLEALERVEQALSAYQVECGPLMTPGIDAEEVTKSARAAIKKARGEG